MNDFAEDAVHFFKRAAKLILDRANYDNDLHDGILFFAFGAERFFKSILHDINPVFVLEKQDFENAIAILYVERMNEEMKSKHEKDTARGKTNSHMLTFSSAMTAAANFSPVVLRNQSTFRHLADLRNKIAHRRLSELSVDDAERFCLMTFFKLVSSICVELHVPPSDCFGESETPLRVFSDQVNMEDALNEKMFALLAKHKALWETRRTNTEFVAKAKVATEALEKKGGSGKGGSVKYPCPACGNDAIAKYEIDGEYVDGQAIPTGVFVVRLLCQYCDLSIERYDEIDYLGLNYDIAGYTGIVFAEPRTILP
jgi:hypothetical protein